MKKFVFFFLLVFCKYSLADIYDTCNSDRFAINELFSEEFVIENIKHYYKKVFLNETEPTMRDFEYFYGRHSELEYQYISSKCAKVKKLDERDRCLRNSDVGSKNLDDVSLYLRDLKNRYPSVKGNFKSVQSLSPKFDARMYENNIKQLYYQIKVILENGTRLNFKHALSCNDLMFGTVYLENVNNKNLY